MAPRERSRRQTFRYKAALIFALTSILPLLAFILVLEHHDLLRETEVAWVIGMSLAIALLGYVFFRKIVKQINRLAEDLLRVERGDAAKLGERDGPSEIDEMARIADAFNGILAELKANTSQLENLIYKFSTLSELTELVSRIPNIQEVLQTVLRRAMTTVNARSGSVMLLDDADQSLRIVAAEGLAESLMARPTPLPLGQGILRTVVRTGEPILMEDAAEDAYFGRANDFPFGASSLICMPLRVHARIIGVLNLAKNGDRQVFGESDLKFLTTLLNHVSFAVENARLLKEAREAAVQLQEMVQEKSLQLDQAQQQILQTAKLSALGQLVAGVTHELSNPLTTVMGYSQLLLGKVQDGKMRRDLQRIFEAAQRAAKIVRNLLSFARQEPPEKRLCDINDLVRKVLEIAAYELPANDLEIQTDLSPSLLPFLADANQLQQVFLNIVTNAHQATMEHEGPRKLMVRSGQDGERLRVQFTDNGPGIVPEHLERIFDPFFTTKAQGKGTGLGLSISYGIVKAHHGEIYVTSQEGRGSTFVVELPIVPRSSEPISKATPQSRPSPPGTGRVLVIDDEESVNDLIATLLLDRGYEVRAVQSSDQGLRELLEKEYDLVVCDLHMPGMDGPRLHQETRRLAPDVARRFLFVTGDTMSEQTQTFLKETGNLCVTKPFSTDTFLDVVARATQQVDGQHPTD